MCPKLATPAELSVIKELALKVNDILHAFFDELGISLVDFKMEFGRQNGKVYLGDEISMDSMRLWDKQTGNLSTKTFIGSIKVM